jgi:hypothetical protein
MAKKRKKKKKEVEKEIYEIEVEYWIPDYHFGLNPLRKDFGEGVYWEHPKLILTGRILSPVVEKASKTRVELAADPQMDDYWKAEPTITSARATGWMEIPRGDDTLIFYCSIPSQSLPFITLAVDSGKIKFVTIWGTKLKWRRGTISSVSLSKDREEF